MISLSMRSRLTKSLKHVEKSLYTLTWFTIYSYSEITFLSLKEKIRCIGVGDNLFFLHDS